MQTHDSRRPPLTTGLSGTEFLRWYWLREELAGFARTLGLRATGGKDLLTQRVAAALDGREFTEPPVPTRSTATQLTDPLSENTVIPPGQRSSQVLRRWFAGQLGPAFHFDAQMRSFIAAADGTTTLADALAHWHGTRKQAERDIDPQFEYNRFTRAWHAANPAGTKTWLLAAWNGYRALPVDERGRA